MSARWDKQASTLVDDLRRVFAGRLVSVAAYGQAIANPEHPALNALVLVTRLSQDDLDECARMAAQWSRSGIETPLILPGDEFRRSLDTFPLEYADIMAAHRCVFGRDPFDDVAINPEDMRRACEKQAKSHLLHLREGYIESQGSPLGVAELVTASAPAFAALLRNAARLLAVVAPSPVEAARAGAAALGLDASIVSQVLALTNPTSSTPVDGARLFPGYLTAVEQLTHAVDTWRP